MVRDARMRQKLYQLVLYRDGENSYLGTTYVYLDKLVKNNFAGVL